MPDLNDNYTIDNGRERFGDSTFLKDGSAAEHSFAALADLDDNADSIIDAADTSFGSLKVWRDFNSDGISQENERFTLQSLSIRSLNLSYQNTDTGLGNGNTLAQKGSYWQAVRFATWAVSCFPPQTI